MIPDINFFLSKMKRRKKKCDYHKCKGIATKQIETKLNKEPYILNVCDDCYEEYLETIEELEKC